MKVIFIEDDRIEAVSDGYARNYLLPRKLAILATASALAAAEKRREKKAAELEEQKGQMQVLAEKLSTLEIVVEADAGEGGKLFGSITSSDIVEAIKKKAGIELDKKKIELEEPLKMVGDYVVTVKLIQNINASLKVKVSAK